MARAVSRVNLRDRFHEIDAEVERRTIRALNKAAEAGLEKAQQQSQPHDFEPQIIRARGDWNGWSSGVRFRNRLVNIFNLGSLGARKGRRLQVDRRKPSWPVTRRRRRYVARRHPEVLSDVSKGVDPLNVTTPARTAGRKALLLWIAR